MYFNDQYAGLLTESAPGRGYSFVYSDSYLRSPHPHISLTLPKRSEKYESETLFPFFSNMLPEGSNRRNICRSLHLDDEDLFGLLSVMADRDFIGAVNIRNARNE